MSSLAVACTSEGGAPKRDAAFIESQAIARQAKFLCASARSICPSSGRKGLLSGPAGSLPSMFRHLVTMRSWPPTQRGRVGRQLSSS